MFAKSDLLEEGVLVEVLVEIWTFCVFIWMYSAIFNGDVNSARLNESSKLKFHFSLRIPKISACLTVSIPKSSSRCISASIRFGS